MLIYTADQIKLWDDYTIANEPVSSINLMERAAEKCAQWIFKKDFRSGNFKIFCGKGNNGGDGLAIARILHSKGFIITVYILESGHTGTKDFQQNLQRLHDLNFSDIIFIQDKNHFPEITFSDIIIDAIFGTGINKPLSGLTVELVNHINKSDCTVISIDLPSGLFIDQSSVGNTILKSDYTLTFQCYKAGLLVTENAGYVGDIHILDIELHKGFLNFEQSIYQLVDEDIIKSIYKRRNRFSHKGSFGHAALVTGSIGLMGAATLSAEACVRTGVGKLTCYIPGIGYNIMQIAVPEAMSKISGSDDFINSFDPVVEHEAIGIGPGIGLKINEEILEEILSKAIHPMVIDADALNMLAKYKFLFSKIPNSSILTPHPKEFDRIFGEMANDFERISVAQKKAKELNVIMILKGHHTLIATPAGKCYFNNTGNAGMATGGSGDVLTGIITGLLAQNYSPEESSLLGVYVHGLAGDLAAASLSEEGMIASDIIKFLPQAFREINQYPLI